MEIEVTLPPFILTDIGTSVDDSPAEDAGSTSELMCRNELSRIVPLGKRYAVLISHKQDVVVWIQLQPASVLRFDVY